ncbi:chemotaxis protein CheC [Halovenus sp. WSH3]|uniref:Chemotaxis protein CheC n=1 Tax=Halovenus carboxidivorans TaxID=2692199 RepID=A0A6B0T0Q0_9EURY|nr:chemotaxis protein CheC [Halovenus carboxidivorans]MXR51445.1 chemotaxis protein CheC [Halovenus carboxidivorans]
MSLKVDVRKLEIFNRVSKEGSRQVADSLSQMSGMDAEIEVAKINLLHMDDVKTHLGEEEAVGIFVELTEPPYGYVLFLLDPVDSKQLARSMVPGDSSAENGFSDMERSAIQEIGNIMTSGYIDGWANVLDTTINMGTPTFSYGPSHKIIEKMGGWPDEEIVFVLDSQITTADADVDLTVYTFPQVRDLVELVQGIDLDTDVEEDVVPDENFVN